MEKYIIGKKSFYEEKKFITKYIIIKNFDMRL